MSYSDQELKSAVDSVFSAYDKDNSGTLDQSEVTKLINDALSHMSQSRQVTPAEVNQFLNAVDANNDGKIAKTELYEIFKKVINSGK